MCNTRKHSNTRARRQAPQMWSCRRKTITYANTTKTTYTYDPLSYRLQHFKTQRGGPSGPLLQSLAYHYDAAGNIVETVDSSDHSLWFSSTTQIPKTKNNYTYDAV